MLPSSIDGSLTDLAVNLLLAAVMASLLSVVYVHCGASFSNRKAFSKNFYLISMTIALIISIVKSSLALSLGLVGALSIVRYRAAIKEPEELAYLFITIAIGIGLGAGHQLVTVSAFALIVGVILVQHYMGKRSQSEDSMNYNLSVVVPKAEGSEFGVDTLVKLLTPHCKRLRVKRFEDTQEHLDISFLIEYENTAALNALTSELQAFNQSTKVFFLDNPYD